LTFRRTIKICYFFLISFNISQNTDCNGKYSCCDIWDTIAVSFDSDEWGNSNIDIQKKSIDESANIIKTPISVKHASKKAPNIALSIVLICCSISGQKTIISGKKISFSSHKFSFAILSLASFSKALKNSSFDSDEWGNSNIDIQKKSIDESANIIKTPISVKHASKKAHLSSHQEFFNANGNGIPNITTCQSTSSRIITVKIFTYLLGFSLLTVLFLDNWIANFNDLIMVTVTLIFKKNQ
jgi:hypothetical protein